jgi:hypothetical protein
MAPLRAEGLAYALRDSHFKSGETAECQTCMLIAEQLVERAQKKIRDKRRSQESTNQEKCTAQLPLPQQIPPNHGCHVK